MGLTQYVAGALQAVTGPLSTGGAGRGEIATVLVVHSGGWLPPLMQSVTVWFPAPNSTVGFWTGEDFGVPVGNVQEWELAPVEASVN